MPDDNDARRALTAQLIAEAARTVTSTITTDRGVSFLLGFQYAPGDLVLDTVTGLTGTILHAVHYTANRRVAGS